MASDGALHVRRGRGDGEDHQRGQHAKRIVMPFIVRTIVGVAAGSVSRLRKSTSTHRSHRTTVIARTMPPTIGFAGRHSRALDHIVCRRFWCGGLRQYISTPLGLSWLPRTRDCSGSLSDNLICVPEVTATEASRSFADLLDGVEHRGRDVHDRSSWTCRGRTRTGARLLRSRCQGAATTSSTRPGMDCRGRRASPVARGRGAVLTVLLLDTSVLVDVERDWVRSRCV